MRGHPHCLQHIRITSGRASRFAALLLAAFVVADVASAQSPIRLRGVVERVNDGVLSLRTRNNVVPVRLADNFAVSAVIKASLSDIKQGAYVGTAAVPQSDGTLRALEVHIFPEAMRGVAEGHTPYDLAQGSTMSNATISSLVTNVNDRTMTLDYKGGSQKVMIPPDAPIVTFAPAQKNELVIGAQVIINGVRLPDGSAEARRISIGRGTVPPL